MDGYPYSHFQIKGLVRGSGWNKLHDFQNTKEVCTLRYSECFGDTTRASEVFTRVAFEKPNCGDCRKFFRPSIQPFVSHGVSYLVLHALVKASGKLGLSAFLPPSDRILREGSPVLEDGALHLPPPHLPLVKDWHDADFSLTSVLRQWSTHIPGGLNVREWTMRMLMRYRFSLGEQRHP